MTYAPSVPVPHGKHKGYPVAKPGLNLILLTSAGPLVPHHHILIMYDRVLIVAGM